MGARMDHWLTGLLAGLLALASVVAPVEHARNVAERMTAAQAHAAPDETPDARHADHKGSDKGHGQHIAPACFACVLVAAPGLPTLVFDAADRIAAVVVAEGHGGTALGLRQAAWAPHRARAPPVTAIA